jgi:hypothetical protein
MLLCLFKEKNSPNNPNDGKPEQEKGHNHQNKLKNLEKEIRCVCV